MISKFIITSNKIHNNKYDYSLTQYVNAKENIIVCCKKHGSFTVTPNNHINRKSGCPICARNKRLTTEEFIIKAKNIHNNKYDYSLSNYINSKTKLIIICKKHGVFEQQPSHHLNGSGCRECLKTPILEFIRKSKIIHDNRYDYSKVIYKNSKIGVEIICSKHGIFNQTPITHLKGQGCPKCAKNQLLTTKEYIKRCNIIHNNFYDYSLVQYVNAKTKVIIICPKHGKFQQKASHHSATQGCPKCKRISSKGEKEVLEYVKSIYSGIILENDRTIIKPKELDIYLPDLKIAFEYNGEYWHTITEERNPGYHKLKKDLCKEKEITLINISDKDWINNKDEIKLNMKNLCYNRII